MLIKLREDFYAISFVQYHFDWNEAARSTDPEKRAEAKNELSNNFRICIMIFGLQAFIAIFCWYEMGGYAGLNQPVYHVLIGRFMFAILLHF